MWKTVVDCGPRVFEPGKASCHPQLPVTFCDRYLTFEKLTFQKGKVLLQFKRLLPSRIVLQRVTRELRPRTECSHPQLSVMPRNLLLPFRKVTLQKKVFSCSLNLYCHRKMCYIAEDVSSVLQRSAPARNRELWLESSSSCSRISHFKKKTFLTQLEPLLQPENEVNRQARQF